MKKLILAVAVTVVTSASSFGFNHRAGLFLDPGDKFILTSNLSNFAGRISIGTFNNTPNFALDSAASLFANFRPANGSALVNFSDPTVQTPVNIESYGNQTTITNGVFTDNVNISSFLGNDESDGSGVDPQSAYVNFYESNAVYIWVSDVTTASNLGTSTTFSIFQSPVNFENSFNVLGGFGEAFVDVNDLTLINVRNSGIQLVPEPSTYAMIGGALVALVAIRRRKTKA